MTLVSITGLGKRYGSVTALQDVDLGIPADGRTAIVGPSGSGKSTLLRLLAGFESPDSGTIHLGGTALVDQSKFVPAHKRGIGYVAQEGSLFPHMTVAANIGFAIPRSDKKRADRVGELLDLVQLERDMAIRRPHELSGGQQQRVAIARALAVRPRLILLDEPFSALDAGLRESVRNSIAGVLEAAEVTTILVTHDQAEALSFASYLAVLRDGRLVQAGSPEQLYRAPIDPDTARFLGDAIVLPAMVNGASATCAIGRVRVSADSAEGPASLLVRPEWLALSTASEDKDGVAGIVTSVEFGGATTVVHVDIPNPPAEHAPVGVKCRVWGACPDVGEQVRIRMSGTAHVFGRAPD